MRVEVFKTNVTHPNHAMVIVDEMQKTFPTYSANFDLSDCDRILRVKTADGDIKSKELITILKRFGCKAEVLADDIPQTIVSSL